MKNDPPSIPIRNAKDGNSVCPPWPSLLGVVMMTEDEAKQKWCPHARVCATHTDSTLDPAHVGYNRIYIGEDGPENFSDPTTTNPRISRCIGSACMAWRWSRGHEQRVRQHMDEWPEDNKFTAAAVSGVGYCGLSGDPK